MRIDCVKVLLIGPLSHRDEFFAKAQELGSVEFIGAKKPVEERPQEVETFIQALRILRRKVPVKETIYEDYRAPAVIAREIVEKNEELERLAEEKRILEKEIARVAPFGDFSLYDLETIEKESARSFQFFFSKKLPEEILPGNPTLFHVGSAYGLQYYFAVNPEKVTYPGLIEMKMEKSPGELQANLASIIRRIDALETDLSILAHHKKQLKKGLIETLNQVNLTLSQEKVDRILEGEVFTVEAWVPKNKIKSFFQLTDSMSIYSSIVQTEEGENAPTYLENNGAARLGEDLIGIYDVPSYQDRDPSLWVYSAFMLFFSMIIADAGYGLILLGISLWLFFKFGKKGGLVRRFAILSTSLSIGCILWGVLTASFFGISFDPDSKYRSLSFVDWMVKKKAEYLISTKGKGYQHLIEKHAELQNVSDPLQFVMKVTKKGEKGEIKYTIFDEFADNVMMEIVIFIGTIHIMLSLLRYVDRNWAAIGWVIFMVGCYLKFPSILDATSLLYYIFHVPPILGAKIGLYLIFIGIGLATCLALIQKKWAGLEEPTKVISIFADVMSYLRIYALALAGVIMAQTFNRMASGLPLYLGILIIFFGHTVNFILALMGGLIHGLRLNFIEWYHYSFEGGGKRFNPLTLHKND